MRSRPTRVEQCVGKIVKLRTVAPDARRGFRTPGAVLFNSFPFIFAFLPLTLLGWELLRRRGSRRARHIWLIAASCVFYAYWNAAFLLLLNSGIAQDGLLESCELLAASSRREALSR